jgi:hypothetical protein
MQLKSINSCRGTTYFEQLNELEGQIETLYEIYVYLLT